MAVVRPGKARETMEALARMGCPASTSFRVFGRGRQKGLRYASAEIGAQEITVRYLPKKMILCVVPDRHWRATVQTIIRVNQSGQFGDGKVFVSDIRETCRIRTGETQDAALR